MSEHLWRLQGADEYCDDLDTLLDTLILDDGQVVSIECWDATPVDDLLPEVDDLLWMIEDRCDYGEWFEGPANHFADFDDLRVKARELLDLAASKIVHRPPGRFSHVVEVECRGGAVWVDDEPWPAEAVV